MNGNFSSKNPEPFYLYSGSVETQQTQVEIVLILKVTLQNVLRSTSKQLLIKLYQTLQTKSLNDPNISCNQEEDKPKQSTCTAWYLTGLLT